MKQKESKKQMYIRPAIEIVGVGIESLMVEASGDHSGIGQGGTVGDAKWWNFLEEDEDEQEFPIGRNMWED